MFWSYEKFQKPLRIENEQFPVRAIHKELLKADHLRTVSDKDRKKRFFQCCNSSKRILGAKDLYDCNSCKEFFGKLFVLNYRR